MAAFRSSARPKLAEGYASAARAELAITLAARDAHRTQLAALDAAASEIRWGTPNRAREALQTAQDRLGAAQRATVDRALALASGDAGDADSVPAARRAIEAAQDAVIAADLASEGYDARLESLEAEQRRLDDRAKDAKAAVLREHVDAAVMTARIKRLQEDLTLAAAEAEVLRSLGVCEGNAFMHSGTSPHNSAKANALNGALNLMGAPPREWYVFGKDIDELRRRAGAKWLAWSATLEADSNAPAPDKA